MSDDPRTLYKFCTECGAELVERISSNYFNSRVEKLYWVCSVWSSERHSMYFLADVPMKPKYDPVTGKKLI